MKTRFTTHHWKRTMSSNFTGTSYCTYLLGMWNLWMRHPCLAPGPFAVEKLPDHPLLAPSYWCWISLIHPAWSKQKHFPAIIWFSFTQFHKNNKGPIWKFMCYFFYTIYKTVLAYKICICMIIKKMYIHVYPHSNIFLKYFTL